MIKRLHPCWSLETVKNSFTKCVGTRLENVYVHWRNRLILNNFFFGWRQTQSMNRSIIWRLRGLVQYCTDRLNARWNGRERLRNPYRNPYRDVVFCAQNMRFGFSMREWARLQYAQISQCLYWKLCGTKATFLLCNRITKDVHGKNWPVEYFILIVGREFGTKSAVLRKVSLLTCLNFIWSKKCYIK